MRRFALCLAVLPAFAAADIHYSLTPLPSSRAIAVSVSNGQPREVETFRIPAWCPGFYFIQDYQDKIYDVVATGADGATLQVTRPDKRAWQVANPKRQGVTLSYKVQGDDAGLGFFGINVLADKAFVNGPAAFMYAEGLLAEKTHLTIRNPSGWEVATGMSSGAGGAFEATGYDELADQPIQLGRMERRSFKVGNYDFEAVFASADNQIRPNLDEQVEVLKKVSEPAIALFGGDAPFKRYVYIVHLASAGFMGGLEHRASTVMAMPNSRNLDLTTLAAHEFFHTWNVKNIRPKVLGPFDYTKEVRTGNLWFAEGVTDYYANLMAYRSGLRETPWLYQTLAGEIQTLQASKSRLEISLEDASSQTWGNGGFGWGDMSYYNKGLVAGFLFDAAIRGATSGDKSLDDVMRTMYSRYRLPKPGYDEDQIRTTIDEVANRDLTSVYNRIIRSKQEVPFELLKNIGLRAIAPRGSYVNAGFTSVNSKVTAVSDTAKAAGLAVGDEVAGAVGSSASTLTLKVLRGGQEETLTLPISTGTAVRWTVDEDPLATAQERKNLKGWLKR